MTDKIAKPFLKWAGGKTQLINDIEKALPKDIFNDKFTYIEPFVGSGAVLFWMLNNFPNLEKAVINDINEDLINTYKTIASRPTELISILEILQNEFHALEGSEENKKLYYYQKRELYNTRKEEQSGQAALFIFLNRTCFNGLYRVNSSGAFNVPWGKLKNPTVCNKELLFAVGEWLRNVVIRNGSYSSALEDAKFGDVVYLDPPYIPLSLTSSFSRYAKDDFLEVSQFALAGVIRGLTSRGVRVVFSNSYTPTTMNIFGDVMDLRVINATRSISAKSSSRGVVQEVIGINFDLSECRDPKLMQSLNQG